LSWPAPWDGSVTTPALMGGSIGSQAVTVNGGDADIVQFTWTAPDPSDYASFGADKAHFCLLARIETASAAPFGMTFAETGNLYANVQNNNNIVWKNISIVDTDGDGARFADVVIGGFERGRSETRLVFETPKRSWILALRLGPPTRRVPRPRAGPMGQGRDQGEGLRPAAGRPTVHRSLGS
jgi:hypothetical protein